MSLLKRPHAKSIIITSLVLICVVGSMALLPFAPEWTWTVPTLNTDGTAIPATGTKSLKEYRFYCDGVAAPKKVVPNPTLFWNSVAGDFTAGNHSCQITAVNNDVAGQNESAKSNAVSFIIAVSVPVAPVLAAPL